MTAFALDIHRIPDKVQAVMDALRVSKGSQVSEERLDELSRRVGRLKGKGWPLKTGRGDLLLTLTLQWPPEWSETQRSLLERLREERGDDPRRDWLQTARL